MKDKNIYYKKENDEKLIFYNQINKYEKNGFYYKKK